MRESGTRPRRTMSCKVIRSSKAFALQLSTEFKLCIACLGWLGLLLAIFASSDTASVVATVVGVLSIVVSAIAIRREILRREGSERALRAAEQKIRDIFDNSLIGSFESTEDGRWLTANNTMAAMLGYDSPEELLRHRNDLKTPLYVDPEARSALIKRLSDKGEIQDCQAKWFRKDGTTVWVTGTGRVVDDGNGRRHFEAMLHDITERKLAEEQLAKLKSELENVLNSATGVSIVSANVQGRITIFNNGAERMLGYSAEEMIGNVCDRFHYDPELTERCRELAARLGRRVSRFDVFVENVREGGHQIRDWTYVRKDGSHLGVSVTVTGIRNAKGDLIGFLSIGTDITERKRAEQDRVLLEQQLRRKNMDLERETRRVLEASRMKSEFLANMSHELRTPLNGIIGFAEMMHDEVIGSVSSDHKEYLNDILISGRHLLQLINDILDLSKVEAGKMEFQPENVDVEALVGEVYAILKSLSNNKQIQIESDLDPRIRHVRLDPRKLKQVVYNYLSNAIKFTPDRGRISVRTQPESGHMFRIEVEDTGIGIKAEDLSQLFVEFQQLDSSTAKRYPGTGLGLALTKRIAEAQGGRVGVESALGKGSTFYAVLPLIGKPLITSDPVLAAMGNPSAKDAQPDDGALELVNTFAFSTEGDEQRTHSDR